MTYVWQPPFYFCQSALTFWQILMIGMYFGLYYSERAKPTWESDRNKLKNNIIWQQQEKLE